MSGVPGTVSEVRMSRGRRLLGWLPFALFVAITLRMGLQSRMPDLDRFLTPDETRWTCRAANFWNGLASGDLAATYQKEHPGVLTMWLGGLGQDVDPEADWAVACRDIPMSKLVAEAPRPALEGIRDRLFAGRRTVARFVALCLVLAIVLSARLLGVYVALMAGVLLMLDPFSIALGRVLHVDALTSSMMLLSALTLLLALHGAIEGGGGRSADGRRGPMAGWLLLSGGLAGLAALAKSPGLFLLPWAGLVLGLDAWERRAAEAAAGSRIAVAMRALPVAVAVALWRLLPWLLAAMAAYLVAWPAMWEAPLTTLSQVFGGAADYAANPHEGHNYYRGRPIGDPGPTFYAVAWWWRTTPWTLLGLVLAAWGIWSGRRTGVLIPERSGFPQARRDLPVLRGLLLFALFFGLFMSLGAKKFDRYLLPAIPPLLVVAGWGWAQVSIWFSRWSSRTLAKVDEAEVPAEQVEEIRSTLRNMGLVPWGLLLFGLGIGNSLHHHHYLTFFNPLAGGQAAAPEALLVGWGEGTGDPARWLNRHPDATELEVATRYRSAFGPLFSGRALEMNKIDPATVDYYLFYINQLQRDLDPELIERYGLHVEGAAAGTPAWWAEIERRIERGAQPPAHVTRIGDLVYALLYENRNRAPAVEAIRRLADPATDVVVARADSGFLRYPLGNRSIAGIEDDPDPEATLDLLRSTLRREELGPVEVIGIDADADRDTILDTLETAFRSYEQVWWVRYDDLIPRPGLDHADHALAVRTFETWSADFPELRLARYERPPGVAAVDFNAPVTAPWRALDVDFADRLGLSGLRLSSEPILWGRGLEVSLRWEALADLDANYTAFLHLIDPHGRRWAQQDRRIGDERLVPTERWAEGDEVEDTYFLSIPPATPPGDYRLLVGVYDGATGERLVPAMRAGEEIRIDGDALAVPVGVASSPFVPSEDLLGLTVAADEDELLPGLSWRGYTAGRPVVGGETASLGLVFSVRRPDPDDALRSTAVLARVTLRDHTGRQVGKGELELPTHPLEHPGSLGDVIRTWFDVPLDGRSQVGPGTLELELIDIELALSTHRVAIPVTRTLELTIAGPARTFDEPSTPEADRSAVDRPAVGARFGDVATLVSAALVPTRVAPGEPVTATLTWRAESEPDVDYQAFLHLVAPDGTIIEQRDQAPGGGARPTSSWLAGEYVVGETALVLPADAPAGEYALIVGLYDPADGARLPVDIAEETKAGIPSGGALERWMGSFLLPDQRIRAATVRVR